MAERLGGGEWSFEVHESWAKIPDEIVLGDCAAVGVDSHDNVYAFNRGDHPVAVFDNDGNLLRTWGEGVFTRPHGVHVAPDDTIWLTDDGDHTVRHCTLDGRVQCRTVWSPSSVSQIVSSGATWTPCGRVKTPSPQVRNRLPSLSKTATGWSPRLKA